MYVGCHVPPVNALLLKVFLSKHKAMLKKQKYYFADNIVTAASNHSNNISSECFFTDLQLALHPTGTNLALFYSTNPKWAKRCTKVPFLAL